MFGRFTRSASATRESLRQSLWFSFLLLLSVLVSACTGTLVKATAYAADGPPDLAILEVFFGLDNALPLTVNVICPGGSGMDGIPVTFTRRVVGTPLPAAFVVTTRSGLTHTPKCVTAAPGGEPLERFTLLMVGDLGDDPGDPPVRLDIVGDLLFEGGANAKGFSSTHVTPLSAGPSLLLALRHAPADLAGSAGSACPSATAQIVLAVWSGGVSDASGAGLGGSAADKFHVTLADAREVSPIALGGTGDHDNYVQLCLADATTPTSVRAEAGLAFDPRGDANAETSAAVTADW